jgi:hypothetical protein
VKKIALGFMLAGILSPGALHAQVMIDMTRITCAEFSAMEPDDAKIFSAWMSGYFNQKAGYTTVDLEAYARNVANVKSWCQANPKETVMAGLARATAKPQ